MARQLVAEHNLQVRLWVDALPALQHIWPSATLAEQQTLESVEVRHWPDTFPAGISAADVVIEAFACDLPGSYLQAMKARSTPPHWFNLEYLSSEDWVADCHGLSSTHPQLGLKKTFFFPGFTRNTGGLLKEHSLFQSRDQFAASDQGTQWRTRVGLDSAPDQELLISLFGYENPAIGSLINAWQNASQPITCLIPPSKLLTSINEVLGTQLDRGDSFRSGALNLKVIPFLAQADYDLLLWLCDINFVRGEDSFVRAQWAAKPLVWHIYPQDDDAHLVKLNAFLDRYLAGLPKEFAEPIRQLWLAWNQGDDCGVAWENCLIHQQEWLKHSHFWAEDLNSLGDLASNMVQFCLKPL